MSAFLCWLFGSSVTEDRQMLVLTRKSEEAVWIGDVRVKVEVIGNRVKLAIEAPQHVQVLREELVKRDERQAEHAKLAG